MCKGPEAGKGVCVQGRGKWTLDRRLSSERGRGWARVFDKKS